ncbi:MAG: hypothetical protein HY868_22715 [Chloroflexi bacterium]|nr:hypothetical protein [Chloroflexota bacterium]
MKQFAIRHSPFANLLALAFLAALVLLFFWRIITPRLEDRAAFPPGDFTDQFWMFRVYAARAFAQGRLPLWSENFNSGHPFLADVQSAVFYPVSLVWTLIVVALRGEHFTLLDLELEAILHFILAGAFTFLFAQRLLSHRIAALVSALTFMFSGYLTSYPPQQLAILETATWLPLTLYFLETGFSHRLTQMHTDKIENPRSSALVRVPFDFIAAGVTLGIAALAGHPQTFLFVAYACVIYFVWRVVIQNSNFKIQNSDSTNLITNYQLPITHHVLHFALTLLIAAGISAAQWVPTLEYQMISTRAAIGWAEASRGFPTLDPIQMILPGFISAFQSPLYVGVLPLWLALFALFARERGERAKNYWAWLAVGSLIVAFGFYAFGYALFYLFAPGFALFRGQERLALVVSFALAMLAGYGMRDLMQASPDVKRARRAWALLPAGITISLMFVFTLYLSGTVRQSGRVAFLGDRAALMALLFTLATALIAWRIRSSDKSHASTSSSPLKQAGLFAALTLVLLVFDLFSINNTAYNASTAPRFPVTSLIETIRNTPGIFRVVDEATQPGHFGIAHRLDEIGGISPLRIAAYDVLRDNLPEEKIYPLLNVRFLLTERPGFANTRAIALDGKTHLLELDNAMPRAWFAPFAIQNSNDDQVLAAMSSDAFDPWYVAYIADASPFPLPSPDRRGAGGEVAHAADFQRITPERVRVIVNAPADGVLVLSENYYYPGWRAFVDGIEMKILRANIALSAVPVRAGAQQVEFVFEPWSVRIGIILTGITVFIVVLSTLNAMVKRK